MSKISLVAEQTALIVHPLMPREEARRKARVLWQKAFQEGRDAEFSRMKERLLEKLRCGQRWENQTMITGLLTSLLPPATSWLLTMLAEEEDYDFLRRVVVELLMYDQEVPECWPPTGD